MFKFRKEDVDKMESKEETAPCRPQLRGEIRVSYSLRNGKSWDYSIVYNNFDYHNCESYEEATAAMRADVTNKVNEIEVTIQENLGKEAGCIHLGDAYIANRDLATVSIRTFETTIDWLNW